MEPAKFSFGDCPCAEGVFQAEMLETADNDSSVQHKTSIQVTILPVGHCVPTFGTDEIINISI